ncbi:MAG: VCBS repeat-containing protein [Phycisphaerae bacterium]|nr:MAG: hypothetical protein F9K17_04100 [Phycisphaerae bacterium]MBE7456303.1 VCBS repeat-containing protein [Planctomycetia bacterium]MCQ3921182.1 hypothetical protein [Planctomycetota bacterium]MCK6464852.1 FG-GAP and VCBS repeat-containing protein [Phycisphaerae bacterium]MCL4718422.1 VCBS repeat-containing protein [Phycisphaerae bacterium]
MAGLFQVLWGQADGTFKKAETLNGTDGQPLIIPMPNEKEIVESICTRPTAVDWDADGDLDLVVGNFSGKFYLFRGEGAGKFNPKPEPIKAGETHLQVQGHHGDPCIVDWDGDGDVDVLSGAASGGVQWSENTAGPKKTPVLKAFAALIPGPVDPNEGRRPHEVNEPAGSTRVCVADVNGDGKLDVLVGDALSLVSPKEGVSEADFVKRRAEWKAASEDLQKQMQAAQTDPPDMEKLEPLYEKFNELYKAREAFMIEERTGFVWVYLRK